MPYIHMNQPWVSSQTTGMKVRWHKRRLYNKNAMHWWIVATLTRQPDLQLRQDKASYVTGVLMADSALAFKDQSCHLQSRIFLQKPPRALTTHTPCAWSPWAWSPGPHLRLVCHSQQLRSCFISLQENSPAQKPRSSRRDSGHCTKEASVPSRWKHN